MEAAADRTREKTPSLLHLKSQAYHRHEIVEQRAIFGTGGRRDDLLRERRDVVAEFRPQVHLARDSELDSPANAGHGFERLRLGEIPKLRKRLVCRFFARATEDFHTAANG